MPVAEPSPSLSTRTRITTSGESAGTGDTDAFVGSLRSHPFFPENSLRSLFVPVVNLEKIPSIPKPDGHGIKVPPKAVPNNSKESLGKPVAAAVPKEPPVPAGLGGDSAMPENIPAPGEKDVGAPKPPPRSHRKLPRESPLSLPALGGG